METVGVVVPTFGDIRQWRQLAQAAVKSIENQTRPADVHFQIHADTLEEARNVGAGQCKTDWLIFLDADDTLHPEYIEKMLEGEGDVRQPATIGVYEDGHTDRAPVVIPKKNLLDGNYIVIGAMIKHDLFDKVGGFRDEVIYEDWSLYLRLEEAGATFGVCREAVYGVFVKENTRNLPERSIQEFWYRKIRQEALQRRGIS